VIEVMIRQLGHLFLQPMMDAMWRQLGRMRPADFSAASALFLIVGTGMAAGRSLKWRGFMDVHGGSPAWRRCGRFSGRGAQLSYK
jgi:hypothetical protein